MVQGLFGRDFHDTSFVIQLNLGLYGDLEDRAYEANMIALV